MITTVTRIMVATVGSVAAIGGLLGVKLLTGDPAPETTEPSAASESGSGTATVQTYVGEAAATRYGNVQVEIDVSSGHIDDIRVIQYPNRDRKDQQINQQAVPILVAEGLAAQSAQVDTVSGATYTSQGYRQSLQSAIDQAGL